MGREGGKVPYKKAPKKDAKELDEVCGKFYCFINHLYNRLTWSSRRSRLKRPRN